MLLKCLDPGCSDITKYAINLHDRKFLGGAEGASKLPWILSHYLQEVLHQHDIIRPVLASPVGARRAQRSYKAIRVVENIIPLLRQVLYKTRVACSISKGHRFAKS